MYKINVSSQLWKHYPLWLFCLPQGLNFPLNDFSPECLSCGYFWALGLSFPTMDYTSNDCECPLVLFSSLPPCSSRHWNTPFLALSLSPHSASCFCPLWWYEVLPPSGCTSHAPGKFSLQFMNALIGGLIFYFYFCYILQTRKLQNWSHRVTPWNETCGRSIVFPLCPKASPHKRSWDISVSEHHTFFSQETSE